MNPNAAPDSPKTASVWLPVAAAAGRLGVSAKTVRKRIAAGELPARRVAQKRGGVAFLVSLETEVSSLEVEAKRKRDGSEKTPSHAQTALEVETEKEARWNRSGSEMEPKWKRDGSPTARRSGTRDGERGVSARRD